MFLPKVLGGCWKKWGRRRSFSADGAATVRERVDDDEPRPWGKITCYAQNTHSPGDSHLYTDSRADFGAEKIRPYYRQHHARTGALWQRARRAALVRGRAACLFSMEAGE